MTNPPGPDNGEPPERGRPPKPAGPPNRGFPPRRTPPVPSESPTRHIQMPGRPQSTARDVPRPQQPGRPAGPPQPPPPPFNRPPQQPGLPPNPRAQQPDPAPHPHEQLTTRISIPTPPPPPADAPEKKHRRAFFKNRTSLLLILLIVALVVVAVPIGAELYARHVASTKVANAVQCEVQDSASVSFSPAPPVLWQYLTKDYSDISVQTSGNQVRSAKGMKVSLDIRDIKLNSTSNSAGTIGSLNGTITWSTDGIKQSIQDAIPALGKFVTGDITTNPGDGTVEMKGLLDSATVKPQIVNNGLSLQVVSLTALGSKMSTDTVQKNLDGLTSKATQNYPLGIHADSIKVTDSGIQAAFSTSNATIPSGGGSQDPCLANL
jgi:LmeA-like phospholipid-binding